MSNLIIVRHGKTEFNKQKRFTGWVDVDISEEGKEDARIVAKKLAEQNIVVTKVYTSWLKRAWQTLDILQAELKLEVPVTKHPLLNERHYGDLQGLFHQQIIEEYGEEQLKLWRRSYNVRPPNGECLADVVHRVQYYYQNEILPQLQAGETVLICAHGNTNRALVKMLENVSDEAIVNREISYDEPLIYTI